MHAPPALPSARKFVQAGSGFFLFSFGLTLLYLGMRGLMAVGGACASGGPYVSAQPCPAGSGYMLLGLFLCGVGAILILVGSFPRGPRFGMFTWCALFLSLGWNFVDFGLFGDDYTTGARVGLLICAVVFGLLGGLPAFFLLSDPKRVLWGNDSEVVPIRRESPFTFTGVKRSRANDGTILNSDETASGASDSPSRSDDSPIYSGDLVADLEKLKRLKDAGALTEEEFAAAKARLIGDPEP